jgi:hypothetical protein
VRGEQFVCFAADRFHFFVRRYDESGEPQIEDINAWFDELDTNKDGVVTLEEYKHYFLKPDENGHTVSVGSLRFLWYKSVFCGLFYALFFCGLCLEGL